MIKNNFKIAWRNLVKNKVYSFINVGGLAVGMSVAMLIGLWLFDELSFDKATPNYDRIVQVMQHQTFDGDVVTQTANPYLLGDEIKNKYGSDFKHIVMSSFIQDHVLSFGEKKLTKTGNFFEPEITEMLSLKMLQGTHSGLSDPASIMLSESLAKAYFGEENAIDKVLKIDNKLDVKVTGVYQDFPSNSSFKGLGFIAPWQLYLNSETWIGEMTNPWRSNFTQTYAQLADNVDIDVVSSKIKDVKINKVKPEERKFKAEVFLHPMSKWHLYSSWKNGVKNGGKIDFVWLFGIIGVFVLLLACINFMNLSTARSEKRAKEVGVRKAIGSERGQLIMQFFSESFLVVGLAFLLALILVLFMLPFFNDVADKDMKILWTNPVFWISSAVFCFITGFVSGLYPALYLSSFQAIKVLKGTFKLGRWAAMPRKVLVVLQFTVSVTLIIGTIIVFRQIQFAKDRPVGYGREGLITIPMNAPELHGHYDAIRNDLLETGVVAEMSQSSSPTTGIWEINNGYEWEGKEPTAGGNFGTVAVTHDYGKSVNWQIKEGRDFSRALTSDSSEMILNETALKFMGLKDPIGKIMKVDGKPFTIIGVIKDMVMESPYKPVFRSVFMLDYNSANVFNVRLKPDVSPSEAILQIGAIIKNYSPAAPFEYKFVDDEYNKKFGDEERIGKLATFFSILAIFISCLGLFGMATFVAEQRTKEIGIRKVLGATVTNLWQLLSKDFVVLVIISCLLAVPIAYHFMDNWLNKYTYKTEISMWIFVWSAVGALAITLMTVSFQAIKAALMNPVKSLKSE